MTQQEIDQIWDLVMAGGTFGRVGRQVGRHFGVVQGLVARSGGIRPPKRARAVGRLSLQDREDIAARLNGRPRKTLGFMPPSRKLSEVLL